MKRSATFHNGTLAVLALAALLPVPASAQRSVEFGYKDRIFEQKYVLPEAVNAVQLELISGASFLQALQSGGSPDKLDPTLLAAGGGTCAAFFVSAQAEPTPTEAQAAIQKLGKRRDSGGWDEVSRSPVTEDKKCVAQLMLFRAAYADSLSTEGQLTQLSSATERAQLDRRLQELNGTAEPSHGGTPTTGQVARNDVQPDSGEEGCRVGGLCRVIETTLFCRTPQQMAAILSQRPGPARKKVLTVLAASGDCRQVAQGETLHWTASIATVQPQGEPMPAEFIGVWASKNGSCELPPEGADGEFPFLVVTREGYEGHESNCRLTSVGRARQTEGAMVRLLTFACEGEGESWQAKEEWAAPTVVRRTGAMIFHEMRLARDGVPYRRCALKVGPADSLRR